MFRIALWNPTRLLITMALVALLTMALFAGTQHLASADEVTSEVVQQTNRMAQGTPISKPQATGEVIPKPQAQLAIAGGPLAGIGTSPGEER